MPKKNGKKRSTTIQTPQGVWDELEIFARGAGHTYVGGGNVSWAVNQAIEFWSAHRAEYDAWRAEQLTKALE